jgi:hypothetical protein
MSISYILFLKNINLAKEKLCVLAFKKKLDINVSKKNTIYFRGFYVFLRLFKYFCEIFEIRKKLFIAFRILDFTHS